MKKLLVLILIGINGCLTESPLNSEFNSIIPKEIEDGHIISFPSTENIDSLGLVNVYKAVYGDPNLWSLRSLLVLRNGNLVAESYLKYSNDISTQHLIWSCTKQVMGILSGIAIERGLIGSLHDPISIYLEDELKNHQEKANITISDLITMESGIGYNNDGVGGQTDQLLRELPDNSVEFVLELPLVETPGTFFDYKDGDPHLLSAIIQNVTGQKTDEWSNQVFFSKIGFTNYNWVPYKDGITFGGFGIETTPRELAKIALCVADSGRWNGEEIIPSNWVKEMTTIKVETDGDYDFGFLWWIDAQRNIYFMWGHGGQFAFIVPYKDLVIVMTSIPNTQGDYQIDADEALAVVDEIIAISY